MNFQKFHIIIPPQDIQCNPECLKKIAAGDRKEFEWLYKHYCSKVYDLALLLTGDKVQSEDITQEVFLKIWLQKEKLLSITNFNTWLHSVTRNHIMDGWRKQRIEKEAVAMCSRNTETINNYFAKEATDTLASALQVLSPKQQLIYKLIREEGQTREQISTQLQLSPNTVKATMQNALHNLRKKLCEL